MLTRFLSFEGQAEARSSLIKTGERSTNPFASQAELGSNLFQRLMKIQEQVGQRRRSTDTVRVFEELSFSANKKSEEMCPTFFPPPMRGSHSSVQNF